MKTKRCNKCLLTLNITNFYDKQGKCKECLKKTRQCIHGRQKQQCKICSENTYCKHKKVKYNCRECNGSNFCEHNVNKYHCIKCDSSQICEHKKVKAQCRECNGSAFCIHKKRKSNCIDCKGSQICIHKKRKSNCIDCKGSQICEHNIIKRYCKKCNPEAFCKHGVEKRQCRKCKGKRICKHGRFKPQCLDCKGSQICKHGMFKHNCSSCGGSSMCIHCKHVKVSKKRYIKSLDKKVKSCARCSYKFYPHDKIPRRYKLRQHFFNEKIIEKFGKDFFQYDKKIQCGCSGKIPDWFIDCFKYSIIIELDENQHKYTSCDDKRMMELFNDLGNRPLIMIRINPDKYKIGEEKIEGCFQFDEKNVIKCLKKEFDKRFNKLIETIEFYLNNEPIKEITIERLFFDKI